MKEKSLFTEHQHLIDCLNVNYGMDVIKLTHLPLGADTTASKYKAQTSNPSSSYFVKLKRGDVQKDISNVITTLLRDAGITHIIPTLKTLKGNMTQHLQDGALTVFPFIEGKDGFTRDLTEDQWVTLGHVMRQIHDLSIPPEIQSTIRKESYSPKWRQAVRSFYPLLETEPKGDDIAIKSLAFMKEHKSTIQRLVDRADQLAQEAVTQSCPFVLCHSDIHGGNVLIGEDTSLYIVDWDDPIIAPKERDLMFIGGGVANVWNKSFEEDLFYQGYGKTDINKILLAYYRHERIVEDIAVYTKLLLLNDAGGHKRYEWYDQLTSQFDPQGVVEIAFKTYEALA